MSQDLHMYFSVRPSMQVIGPKGQRIPFVSGKYFTRNAQEIEFLNEMVAEGRDITVDPNKLTITDAERDPMNALRAKFFQEFLAEQQAHLNPENDVGTSVQGQLTGTSTRDVAPVAAGGNATALHDQVAKLIPGPTGKK